MISIVVPFYNNSEEQIKRCINSIRTNGYEDYEIIIINDGSLPSYKNVLDQIEATDKRIKVYSQKNAGSSAARNLGIQKAAGEYIMFLDADDKLVKGCIENGLSIALKYDLDLVIGGMRTVHKDDDIDGIPHVNLSGTGKENRIKIYENDELIQLRRKLIFKVIEFEDGYIGRGPVCRLARKDLLQDSLFHRGLVFGEDLVWNQELIMKCRNAAVVKNVWYLYYRGDQSITYRFNPDVIDQYELQFKYLRRCIDLNDDEMFLNYCMRVGEGLVHVYLLLLSRKEWKASHKEKRQVVNGLYKNKPWSILGTKRYYMLADRREKIKCLLYRSRLFFVAFRIQSLYGGI